MSPVTASISKRYAFPAERVFDAWLEPAMLGRWMFGPNVREERIVRLTNDARVGGQFSFVVDRGGEEIDHLGEYLEITRPTRLIFTWTTRDALPSTSRVVITIEPLAPNSCQLTLVHEMSPEWADYVPQTRDAWAKMADALERALTA